MKMTKKNIISTILNDSPKQTLEIDELECPSCLWSGTIDDGIINQGTWSCPECHMPAKQYNDDAVHCINISCDWWDSYSDKLQKQNLDFIACPKCSSKTAWGTPKKE
jgi:Zn finger protein HypA/HybF involved in hydrogenase expression